MFKVYIIDGNQEIELSTIKDNIKTYIVKGEPGFSPTIETNRRGKTTTVSVTSVDGIQDFDIEDGFDPIVNINKQLNETTISITDVNGTQTSTILDGDRVPTQAVIGYDGTTIPNGYVETSSGFASLDQIYPVGSIYMNVNSTNPSAFFGGTWVQLKDKFLLAAGDTYNAGTSGGASSTRYTPAGTIGNHALTVSEIPSHNHTYDRASTVTGSHTLTISEIPSHSHSLNNGGYVFGIEGIYAETYRGYSEGGLFANSSKARTGIASTGGNGGHTHPMTLTSTNSGDKGSGEGHNHNFTGTQATIDTMPPYLTVYVWQRTA